MLITFFLPLSRCYYLKHPDAAIQPSSYPGATVDAAGQYQDTYAYRRFRVTNVRGWLILLAFAWPVSLAVLSIVRPLTGTRLLPIEPIACVGSGILLATLLEADRILWGGYLAVVALAVYFLTAIAQFARHARAHYLKRLRGPPNQYP